jgi:hypothetical protein
MISLSCLVIGPPVGVVGVNRPRHNPPGAITGGSGGRQLSAGMEISCPSAWTSLSGYMEYALSALMWCQPNATKQFAPPWEQPLSPLQPLRVSPHSKVGRSTGRSLLSPSARQPARGWRLEAVYGCHDRDGVPVLRDRQQRFVAEPVMVRSGPT